MNEMNSNKGDRGNSGGGFWAMNIVYASDDRYAQHLGISMLSLFVNNQDEKEITVYILDNQIADDSKAKLVQVANTYGRCLVFVSCTDSDIRHILGTVWADRSLSAYSRLFIGELLPASISRILYLDCDTIVLGDIRSVYSMDLSDSMVAGVWDTVSSKQIQYLGLRRQAKYINSGVLLIPLQNWRTDKVGETFVSCVLSFDQGRIPYVDQSIINKALTEKIRILPASANLMTPFYQMSYKQILTYYNLADYYTEKDLVYALANPLILHYTPGFTTRPWVKGSQHPCKDDYLYYKSLSPWKDRELERDSRPIKLRLIDYAYRILPFSLFSFIVNLAERIKKALD